MISTSGLAQLFIGGTLASLVGRLWALRISICLMIIGVLVICDVVHIMNALTFQSIIQVVPNTYAVLLVGRLVT